MQHELAEVLQEEEEWNAQSFTSRSGRLGIVLTAQEDSRYTRIVKIQIDEENQLADYQEFTTEAVDQTSQLEHSRDVQPD